MDFLVALPTQGLKVGPIVLQMRMRLAGQDVMHLLAGKAAPCA